MSDTAPSGIRCPRCEGTLDGEGMERLCASCGRAAWVLQYQPVSESAEVQAGMGRCANHATKDAVASCSRCGSFVCGVCLTRTGENSLCPACFDTLHSRGDLETTRARRVRWDYAAFSLGGVSLVCSMPFGVVGGPLAIGFGIFALVRRRKEPWLSATFIALAILLGVVALGISIVSIAGMASLRRHR